MEFQSRIFVKVSNPGARMVDIGGALFIGTFVLIAALKIMQVPYHFLLFWPILAVLAGILIIVGRKMAKGNMFSIGLSDTELVVSDDGVRVGDAFYPHDQLTNLDFWIEGYDGMVGTQFRGYRSFRNQGKLSGADNKIHFRFDGKKHLYQFYLQDENSMNNLSQVFRKYYERRMPFRECNRGGPTFLFHQVRSKNELEDMKRKEGYV